MSGVYRPNEVIGGDVDFFIAYTLVDITDTGNRNPKGMTVEYQQAQNLNTLIQLLSMRSQLLLSSTTLLKNQDMRDYEFGSEYEGLHDVWQLKFASEHPDVWLKESDPLFFANSDCNLVPIHIDLYETAPIANTFITTNTLTCNLYFKNSKSL